MERCFDLQSLPVCLGIAAGITGVLEEKERLIGGFEVSFTHFDAVQSTGNIMFGGQSLEMLNNPRAHNTYLGVKTY